MSEIKQLPSFDDVAHLLGKSSFYVNPSYAHGFWVGMIAGGRHPSPKAWIDAIIQRREVWAELSVVLQHLFLGIAEASVEQLGDETYLLQLLLPEDDDALDERLHAVREWCQAFCDALGFDGEDPKAQLKTDALEAYNDLLEVRELSLDIGEDPEDEKCYSELIEYIRVAVSLIHHDLLAYHAKTSEHPPFLH